MIDENGLKMRNSGEFGGFQNATSASGRRNHITSFDKNAKKHETREIFTHGIREMEYSGIFRHIQAYSGIFRHI